MTNSTPISAGDPGDERRTTSRRPPRHASEWTGWRPPRPRWELS